MVLENMMGAVRVTNCPGLLRTLSFGCEIPMSWETPQLQAKQMAGHVRYSSDQ